MSDLGGPDLGLRQSFLEEPGSNNSSRMRGKEWRLSGSKKRRVEVRLSETGGTLSLENFQFQHGWELACRLWGAAGEAALEGS